MSGEPPTAVPPSKRLITLHSGTFNEAGNIDELIRRVWSALEPFREKYDFRFYIIDNASTDGTPEKLRQLAASDARISVILNMRNFGAVRSGFHGFLQGNGDAAIVLASDLQDPPEMIPDFIQKWEAGFPVVLASKATSEESALIFLLRRTYYRLVARLSDVPLLQNVTGFGLYDRAVMEQFRKLEDPYPYVRGIISDFGYPVALLPFTQPLRKSGRSSYNLYALYDFAMLGITSFSKVPLRLAAILGFVSSLGSLLVAFLYLIYKLLFWNEFAVGIAPLVIGLFLFASVQLFFIGIVGEYIGAMHTQLLKRPRVIERERINC
ncbi:MAG: glycosyltransferase [Verrucomicrobia bacterium]|nr:glycosyltransferase [Verrucomicrobiota bacterium]